MQMCVHENGTDVHDGEKESVGRRLYLVAVGRAKEIQQTVRMVPKQDLHVGKCACVCECGVVPAVAVGFVVGRLRSRNLLFPLAVLAQNKTTGLGSGELEGCWTVDWCTHVGGN